MVRSSMMQKKYDDFINSYKGRILSWAIPFSIMPPQDIVNHHLTIRYTVKSDIPYIWYNDKYYWIFPKLGKYENSNHKLLCKSTYGFFKNLYDICLDYVNCIVDPQECHYYKANYEYQGQWYVFCSYNNNKVET